MLGLGSCLGRCPALQPWLASALLPALPALLSQGTPLGGDCLSGCTLALRWVSLPGGTVFISFVPHWA